MTDSGASKPVERSGPAPDPVERDDVKIDASPTRCPYCHEGVDTREAGWVACGGCMARHHAACWDERGSCSSCGGVRRLVAEDRRPATDVELVELMRAKERPRALAELRARGLDERSARTALDLVGTALAATRGPDLGWTLAGVTYALQALAMGGCALLAANTAEAGAVGGFLVMVTAALGLGIAAWAGRASRPWLLLLAVLNLVVTGAGPLLVVGLNIPSQPGSAALCIFAVMLTVASVGLSALSAKARKSSD